MKAALARLVSSSTALLGVGLLIFCAVINEHYLSETNQINLTVVASLLVVGYSHKEAARRFGEGKK